MKECSKTIVRRISDPNFMRLYFRGCGLDIGGKPDPLYLYTELFPLVKKIYVWDKENGDAQYLESVADASYDFVHSSHCLEHLNDPVEGLKNWIRVLKPNGYLIVTVPDEDMYEQGKFPSFNTDHKWTFTIWKESSWSPKSINIFDVLKIHGTSIEKVELLNSTYRNFPRYDQTLTPIAECGIEFILKKNGTTEKNNLRDGIRIHLNQYKDDWEVLKKHNKNNPPFRNKTWKII